MKPVPKLRCRIHGPNQNAFLVCSHIVDGESCKKIEVDVEEDGGGQAICERDHYDHLQQRVIGKEPTVMCEGCMRHLVARAREQQQSKN